MRSTDPEASREFWTGGLGFTERGEGDEGAALGFEAMMPSWSLAAVVTGTADERPTQVDAEGCVLATMLTRDLDRELARLRELAPAGRTTGSWSELVGGREVRVAFVEGPGGELVELLEPLDRPRR